MVVIGTTCMMIWALLAAPALRRAAETSPLGARRTAALAVLGPLARLTSFIGLDRPQHSLDVALGRTPPPAAPEPRPPREPAPRQPSADPAPAVSPGPTPGGSATPPGGDPSTNPPPSAAPVLPTPTQDNRLRVLVVGDSLAVDLGIGLSRLLDGDRFVTKVDARESTGLARPDYFDWPAQTALDVSSFHPNLVVAMFGANDDQGFLVGDGGVAFGTGEWRTEYTRRVAGLIRQVTSRGPAVAWVGLPPMASQSLNASARTLNGIYRSQANRHDGVVYIDPWPLFSGPNGHYSAFLPNASGQEELVRQPDGVHLTSAGDVRLAQHVIGVLKDLWKPERSTTEVQASPSGQAELQPSAPGPDGRLVD